MKWRTHDEKPDTSEPVTALLMIPDDEGDPHPCILAGMYLWKNDQWMSEETFKPCPPPFWWVLEAEVVATRDEDSKYVGGQDKDGERYRKLKSFALPRYIVKSKQGDTASLYEEKDLIIWHPSWEVMDESLDSSSISPQRDAEQQDG